MIVLERSVSVKIPDEPSWADATLDVAIEASIAQDLEATASEPVDLHVRAPKGFTWLESSGSFVGSVAPGSEVIFTLKTGPYPEDRSILILPRAELHARRVTTPEDDA